MGWGPMLAFQIHVTDMIMIQILITSTGKLFSKTRFQIQINISFSAQIVVQVLVLFGTQLTLCLQQMVPTSPEGSKGSYPSQHYPTDEPDGASTTKDASSETEGWSYFKVYFLHKKSTSLALQCFCACKHQELFLNSKAEISHFKNICLFPDISYDSFSTKT